MVMALLKPFFLFIYIVLLLHSGSPLVAGFVRTGNETDLLALLAIKAAITSDPFRALNSWNESIHFCHWVGVTCGPQHHRVTVLRLQHQELTGSISPHVGNLSFLRELSLGNNSLTHEIPLEVGRLRRLQILNMANNFITGQIPSSISSCSNLVALELSGNKLAGKIPSELGSMTKLEMLLIGSNNITGGLPSTLGNLSSLINLSAYFNSIAGNIPDTLGECKKLEVLRLGVNMLVGTFPSSIYNLTSMRYLLVPNNKLEGSLPSDIGITLPNLQELALDKNLFTGSIPMSVSNATKLYGLFLSINRFKGKVPPLEKLRDLEFLVLDSNQLGTGEVDDLSFLNSLTNATKFSELYLGDNNFGGVLPESISNFSKLSRLSLHKNDIGGSIPTGIGNLINLQLFYIDTNRLSGKIPADIGKLRRLQFFGLYHNQFYGDIPPSLSNLTYLVDLDLAENNLQSSIPSSLGKCQRLENLNLSQANLNGIIPREVVSIASLRYIDLSGNNLAGDLPAEVGILKNLDEFRASKNKLTGRIPSTIGSCVMLRIIDLSGNEFWGNLPTTLANLRGVEELNLSHNKFSGQIPEYLARFIFLHKLDLSSNDFEGAVPEGRVSNNATAIFVKGNNKLCGGIAELQLRSCNSKKVRHEGFTLIGKTVLSASIGLIGLLVMLGVLYLCWSRKSTNVPPFEILGNSFPQVSYQSLLRATEGFSPSNLIGVGSFGSVYKGLFDQSGKVVAVKVLNLQFHGASKSYIAECKAMKSIKHRNLVRILTACSSIDHQGNDFKALVYEFMVNGSLHEWLHPNEDGNGMQKDLKSLNLLQRLNIAIDVASALDYLHHHCTEPMVHCDLKPSNVLLDNDMTACVADFGLARYLLKATDTSSTDQSSSIGMRGTVGYAAPEYGMGNEVSTSGDVYSYRILLLEMVTRKRPTDTIFIGSRTLHNFAKTVLSEPMESIFNPALVPEGEIREASSSVSSVLNPSSLSIHKIHECLISLLQVGITCSEEQATCRPDMSRVLTDLHKIKKILLGSRVHGGRRS